MKEQEESCMSEDMRQQEQEVEPGFSFEVFCEEVVALLMMAYLFIIFCIYPFYMKNGYVEIGKEKYEFFKAITIGAFCLIVPLALICVAFHLRNNIKNRKNVGFLRLGGMSCTDWTVLAYGISAVFSYIASQFKDMALWGEKGWNMGLVTQLIFVLSYFLVSRFWEFEEKLLLAFMAASSVVLGLGVLNRFSVYPIEVKGANNGFLSTMGNINWFCGYWAVLFPIGFVLYWCAEKLWMRLLALLGVIIGIAAGVSQGSNSAFIVFVGVYVLVFCLSFQNRLRMKRFFELAILFCGVCQGLRLWRMLQPEAFDYYDSALSSRMTMSRITLYALVPLFLIYILLCLVGRKKDFEIRKWKMVRQIVVLLLVVVAGVYVFLLVLNSSMQDGIRSLGEWSALVFDNQWGSARGATWSAGVRTYQSIPTLRRLIGVGSDCFATYLYTIPQVAEAVIDQFGGARLTNAHNEWLTILVNQGIFGFISYGGIFITAVIRYVYHGEKALNGRRLYLYVFALSAFAYAIHNVVSFQQILSTPFVFLMLGMGECLVRAEDERLQI